MRSVFLKSLCLLALAAGEGWAMSLYDTAPAIGLPVSEALKYTLTARVGYNDNLNSTRDHRTRSIYTGMTLRASYSDFESVDKKTLSATLGATYYFKRAYSTNNKWFSNNNITASLSHRFSDRMTYSVQASLRYQPEPDYSNGMSASRAQGDCFNWSLHNTLTRSIDARWNWSANASYTGNTYSTSAYRGDNRQYINGGLTLTLRPMEHVSYSLNVRYRYDLKDYGYNSNNIYGTLSMSRSLTPYSSMNVSVGVQQKYIHGRKITTPTFRGGYNRTVVEGLSIRFYASLDNENVNTYRGALGNYLSDPTWRIGVTCSYKFTPDLSFNFGCTFYRSSYSRGEGTLSDTHTYSWNPMVGATFRITDKIRGNIHYTYTASNSTYGNSTNNKHYRNNISASASYTF